MGEQATWNEIQSNPLQNLILQTFTISIQRECYGRNADKCPHKNIPFYPIVSRPVKHCGQVVGGQAHQKKKKKRGVRWYRGGSKKHQSLEDPSEGFVFPGKFYNYKFNIPPSPVIGKKIASDPGGGSLVKPGHWTRAGGGVWKQQILILTHREHTPFYVDQKQSENVYFTPSHLLWNLCTQPSLTTTKVADQGSDQKL